MQNKRNLPIGGVGLIPGTLKNAGPCLSAVCDELEPHLERNEFLANAPFKTVSLIFRFGSRDNLDTQIKPINSRFNELPAAIEFDLYRLKQLQMHELLCEFRQTAIEALIDISANLDLPFEFLNKMQQGSKENPQISD